MSQAKLTGKAPYSQYKELEQEGVNILFGDAGDLSQIPVDEAEIVYDNNAKALDVNKALIDAVKVGTLYCTKFAWLEPKMQNAADLAFRAL